ncbi:hypothetical protein D3C80_955560 [compost metagenome]
MADLALQIRLQGAGGRQVETVEVIQRPAQRRRQAAAGDADAFVGNDRLNGRLGHPVAVDGRAGEGRIGQRLVDDVAGREDADVAVGQQRQFRTPLGQKVRGAALGDHQRQHLAQGQATGGEARGVVVGGRQGLVDLGKISAIPDAQTLGHAMHFAMPGHRRQRYAVEVVAHDTLACFQGLRATFIRAHAGGNHLADLLAARGGQAVGGMPVFFQLGRQGTAARRLAGQGQVLRHLGIGGLGKARPVHGGVVQRVVGVEQVAVFDEQQAVDNDRRDRGEVGVQVLRVMKLVQRIALAVGDRQAGLNFFGVGNEKAVIDVVHQRRRKARLLVYHVVALQ